MADILVSSVGMREKSSTFRSIAESIKNYTEDMKKTVENLRSSWEGTASEETRKTFANFQGSFDDKYNTIIGYAKFLEEAADAYDKTESANAQNG